MCSPSCSSQLLSVLHSIWGGTWQKQTNGYFLPRLSTPLIMSFFLKRWDGAASQVNWWIGFPTTQITESCDWQHSLRASIGHFRCTPGQSCWPTSLNAIHQWPSWCYPPSNEHRLTCRWYQNAPPILKMKDCDILGQDLTSLNTRSYETNMKFRVRVRVQSVNSRMKENYCNSWLSPQRCKLTTCSGRNRSYHF